MGLWAYKDDIGINCYRFANPGEALRGFEASRLCGLHVLETKKRKREQGWEERKDGRKEGGKEGAKDGKMGGLEGWSA